MTYTNLPPTLYEMFGSLDDRVRKLETGPNLAYATGYDALQQAQGAQFGAIQAYSVATQAQIQAINAGIQANLAQSQATVAQSTASFAQSLGYAAQATANSASAQATLALNTANGKNKVYYSLVTPGTTANTAGDIWFQYSGSGLVIGQYVGLGGTSWQQQTITQAVIGNLDAGKVTTGILNAIEITAGAGSQSFRVTPTGFMSAQGAYIKGNITADSGTFNGTVNASAGYFGNFAGGNYWSISATGLTAVGTGTITGGLIQGSSIQVPQVSPLFQVNSLGQITATAGSIGGTTITSTTLTGGTIQTSTGDGVIMNGASNALQFRVSGSIAGNIVPFVSAGMIMHYGSTPDTTGGTYPQVRVSSTTALLAGSTNYSISVTSTGNNVVGSTTFLNDTQFQGLSNSFPNITQSTSAANLRWGTTTGGRLFESTASSARFKTDIVDLLTVPELDPKLLLNLPVRAFRYRDDYLGSEDERSGALVPGFIAEEVDEIYPIVADYELGQPNNWNDKFLVPAMLSLIQDLYKEINLIKEGNNG